MKKILFFILVFLFIYINCFSKLKENLVRVDISLNGFSKSYYVIFSNSKNLNSFRTLDEADGE